MPAIKNDPNNELVKRYQKSQVFQTIWASAARNGLTRANVISAADWFRNKARTIGRDVKPEDLMSDEQRLRSRFEFGSMYSYFYVPKWKDDLDVLPYYDLFPLIFPVEPAEKGFYGINLHYLPPTIRAALMDELFTLRNNDRFNEKTRLRLSYSVLKQASKLNAFQPCFKHYLWQYVYSRFMSIEADEWNIALFLPTERFVRATRQQVWKDSRKMIGG